MSDNCYFEMNEVEANLENIMNSLEFANYQLATGNIFSADEPRDQACGVYGSMMHTTFCDKSHSQEVFDNMKRDLQEFIDKDTTAEEEDIFYEEFTSKY